MAVSEASFFNFFSSWHPRLDDAGKVIETHEHKGDFKRRERPCQAALRGAISCRCMTALSEVINDWYKRVAVTQRAHYSSADRFGRRKYWLGIPAVILSTLVGTSVFASLLKQPDPWLQITLGFASVAAAVLASLQIFLGYSERAEKHRIAGAKYGALGRELEQLRSLGRDPTPEEMSAVRKRLDDLAVESPNNPIGIYNRAGFSEEALKRLVQG